MSDQTDNKLKTALECLAEVILRKDSNPYEARCLLRTELDGLTVSTAWTHDEGYETAILDRHHAHPVERYEDKKLAEPGHARWCKFIESGQREIVRLGGFKGTIDDETMTLEPEAGR